MIKYPSLKPLISSILADCECENPTVDIEDQLDGTIDDLELLKESLTKAVAGKPSPANPSPSFR